LRRIDGRYRFADILRQTRRRIWRSPQSSKKLRKKKTEAGSTAEKRSRLDLPIAPDPPQKIDENFGCVAELLLLIVNHMVKYSSRLLNRTFAALADPTRRRILAHLAHGDRCVTDLARPHAMSLPAVSKHLRVLEKAGLLRRRRYGRVHEMQLDAKPLQQAAQWVEEYRKFWEGSLDRLAEYLEKANRQSKKKKMT
jgi:DNA-binding transcriptional ArsR family regulator